MDTALRKADATACSAGEVSTAPLNAMAVLKISAAIMVTAVSLGSACAEQVGMVPRATSNVPVAHQRRAKAAVSAARWMAAAFAKQAGPAGRAMGGLTAPYCALVARQACATCTANV